MNGEAFPLTQQAARTYARSMAQESSSTATLPPPTDGQAQPPQEVQVESVETPHKKEPQTSSTETVAHAQQIMRTIEQAVLEILPDPSVLDSQEELSKAFGKLESKDRIAILRKIANTDASIIGLSPNLRRIRQALASSFSEFNAQEEQQEGRIPGSFNEGIIARLTQFATGEDVEIIYETDAKGVTVETNSDTTLVTLPKNPDIATIIELAKKLHPEAFSKEAESNMVQFARDLQKAALLMETEVFGEIAVTRLYNLGEEMMHLVHPEEELKQTSFADIQLLSRTEAQQDRNRIFMEVVMGAHPFVDSSKHTFYVAYFARWQSKQPQSTRDSSLIDQQREYDLYLQDGKVQEGLLRFMKRPIQKALEKGGKAEALAQKGAEGKVEKDILNNVVRNWQEVVINTPGIEPLFEKAKEIHNAGGPIDQQLRKINELFLPKKEGKADALEYVPAEVLKVFQENNPDLDRNQAACAVAAAYEKHVLDKLGLTVFSDLQNAHATLLVVQDGKVFEVDPSEPLGAQIKNRDAGVASLGDVPQELTQIMQKQPQIGTYRVLIDNTWHTIGGTSLITSEFLGNAGALDRYLENIMPNATPEDLQAFRFALAKKAVDMAPENYLAWAMMGKYATDGKREEYVAYAKSIDRRAVEQIIKEDKYLVGAFTLKNNRINKFLDENGQDVTTSPNPEYKQVETIEIIDNFKAAIIPGAADKAVRLKAALVGIQDLISAETPSEPRGAYGVVINNLLTRIETEAFLKKGDNSPEAQANIKEWQSLARFTLEFGLENVIGQNDFNPRSSYSEYVRDLYVSSNINAIFSKALTFDEDLGIQPADLDTSISRYLDRLKANRYGAHEIFRNITEKKSYQEGVAGYINEQGLQFLEHRVAGVDIVQRLYEKVYAEMNANLGHIPSGTDFLEYADIRIQGHPQSPDDGMLRQRQKNPNTQLIDPATGFPMQEFQIRRAGVVGMQLTGLAQRRQLYGVMGDYFGTVTDLVKGLVGEGSLDAFGIKMAALRYFDDINSEKIIHRLYLNNHKQGAFGRQYGLIQGGGLQVNDADKANWIKWDKLGGQVHYKGLYGQSEKGYAILDNGAQDPKSNPWIAELLFLRNKQYETAQYNMVKWDKIYIGMKKAEIDAERTKIGATLDGGDAIGVLLDKVKDAVSGTLSDMKDGAEKDKIIRERFNEAIRTVIKDQRISLGALIHYGYSAVKESPLDEQNQAYIWDKISTLNPSRIAFFLPKEVEEMFLSKPDGKHPYQLTIDQWKNFKEKLFWAEEARVQEDVILLRSDLTNSKKLEELQKLNPNVWNARGLGDLTPRDTLDEYLNREDWADAFPGLTPDLAKARAREMVSKITNIGRKYTATDINGESLTFDANGDRNGKIEGGFARMTFIFTPLLDDGPAAEWTNMDESLLKRHLIGNQDSYAESGSALTNLIYHLVKKPGDNIEMFQKVYEPLTNPMGKKDAQQKMKVVVLSYAELVKEKLGAKYFGIIYKMLRIPRSEIEEGNLQANLAFAEQPEEALLSSLAQVSVISDTPQYENNLKGTLEHIKDTLLFKEKLSMYQQLRKDLGADRWHVFLGLLRTLIMLFGPVFGVQLLKAMLPEELSGKLAA